MKSRRTAAKTETEESPRESSHAPGRALPDPDHIVVVPLKGATQSFGAAVAGGTSALLPVIGKLFDKDGHLSLPAVFGIFVFSVLIGWGILRAMGRARQREVFWEASKNGLMVHLDNIGPLRWDQIRMIDVVKARPRWLMGDRVVAIAVYPWMPRDVRRRMKPDPDVKYLVRNPVMMGDHRFLRLPIWQTKMREHGKEIEARLRSWLASSAGR